MANPPATAAGTSAAQTQAMQAQNAMQVNAQISAAIRSVSQDVKQSIFSAVIPNPQAGNNVVQIPFRNVGLVKGFIVKLNATFSAVGGADPAAVPTDWNVANLLSNVTVTDLDNYQRVNTTGLHLNMLGTSKEGFVTGAALLQSAFDTPIKYGNTFSAVSLVAPTIDGGAPGSAQMYYWVPLAYSASDLRGAIWAGVVNATAFLQLTINPTPWIVNTADPTLAVFTSAAAATPTKISTITVQVYQSYLDQVPKYQGGANAGLPILPPIDISTQYRLNNTSLTGISVGQDFPIPFTNFQSFLSLGLIYDQNGTLNGSPTDLNYFALAAANTYLPFKVDPITQAWITRHKIKTDLPKGSWLFDFRGQPINTNQTGNMQLLANAISAAAGSQMLAFFESFALVQTLLGAASLPAS